MTTMAEKPMQYFHTNFGKECIVNEEKIKKALVNFSSWPYSNQSVHTHIENDPITLCPGKNRKRKKKRIPKIISNQKR